MKKLVGKVLQNKDKDCCDVKIVEVKDDRERCC